MRTMYKVQLLRRGDDFTVEYINIAFALSLASQRILIEKKDVKESEELFRNCLSWLEVIHSGIVIVTGRKTKYNVKDLKFLEVVKPLGTKEEQEKILPKVERAIFLFVSLLKSSLILQEQEELRKYLNEIHERYSRYNWRKIA